MVVKGRFSLTFFCGFHIIENSYTHLLIGEMIWTRMAKEKILLPIL